LLGSEENSESTSNANLDNNLWRTRADCLGSTTLFFTITGETRLEANSRESRALVFCSQCPVTQECLSYAIESGQQNGIWGGLTEAQIRHIT
jgi:WhiB family transcriptional regulator, redox-sensing transcriptional regulator